MTNDPSRAERLKAALRANLRRRKAGGDASGLPSDAAGADHRKTDEHEAGHADANGGSGADGGGGD